MPKVTLADIKAAADQKYGPFIIEMPDGPDVELPALLRLPEEARKEFLAKAGSLTKIKDQMDGEAAASVDIAGSLEDALRIVARTKRDGDRLVKACGGDAAVLIGVLTEYTEATKVGEASPSES